MDLIQEYLQYTKETESPIIYHRWCIIAGIGALLSRSCYINLGHFRVFPNLYTMLIGEPAARKSSAIKISKKLLLSAGYETFAADKTTKEKFLVDLEGKEEENDFGLAKDRKLEYDFSTTAKAIFGDLPGVQEPREVYIAADEFNEFSGVANLEFFTTLGNLWDWDSEERPFEQRLKNSRSISIYQPTVSILGGNTSENFSRAFPPEIIGQGFLSRLILIYGERSGRKYPFPPVPRKEDTEAITNQLRNIRKFIRGEVSFTEEARSLRADIYYNWQESDDARFKGYYQRRDSQLLKLALIISASRGEIIISRDTLLQSNTILAAAEINMPRALGEFGKARTSETVNLILNLLDTAVAPMSLQDLWKFAIRDLEKIAQLIDILHSLVAAKRIQFIPPMGYLPLKQVKKEMKYVDFDKWLTTEEQEML